MWEFTLFECRFFNPRIDSMSRPIGSMSTRTGLRKGEPEKERTFSQKVFPFPRWLFISSTNYLPYDMIGTLAKRNGKITGNGVDQSFCREEADFTVSEWIQKKCLDFRLEIIFTFDTVTEIVLVSWS